MDTQHQDLEVCLADNNLKGSLVNETDCQYQDSPYQDITLDTDTINMPRYIYETSVDPLNNLYPSDFEPDRKTSNTSQVIFNHP